MSELISGRDAWLANFDGEHVQYKVRSSNDEWDSFKPEDWLIEDLKSNDYEFRLKPKTITINGVEIVAPFDPKVGQYVWFISDDWGCGYSGCEHKEDSSYNFGCWATEDDVKQAVLALKQAMHTKP